MFFNFRQNNSGAYLVRSSEAGVAENVVVEANNAEHAMERLDDIRKRFGAGFDDYCDCCGARWGRVWDDDGFELEGRMPPCSYVHFLDGRVATGDEVDAEVRMRSLEEDYY